MPAPTTRLLLELLADGQRHSGAELGAALSLSRAAVWKQVQSLRTMGVPVSARRSQGYCLPDPLELLSAEQILAALEPGAAAGLGGLEVAFTLDSTSARLLAEPAPAPGTARALFAEYQTGGRGRRGRRWLSPLGSGLCFSLSWTWEAAPRDLAALGLVAGVAVADALESVGARNVALKWPNDVVGNGGKLGGILVDVSGEPAGALKVVVGIGINVRLPPALPAALAAEAGALPPADLSALVPEVPSRNVLAARLLSRLLPAMDRFAQAGFGAFADPWRRRDWLNGRPVAIATGTSRRTGIARGIAADGSLLVEGGGQVEPVLAGDVSLREAP